MCKIQAASGLRFLRNFRLAGAMLVLAASLLSLWGVAFAQAEQTEKDKANERVLEKKFAEYLGITDVLQKLESGRMTPDRHSDPVPATTGLKLTGVAATRTAQDIEAACGKAPYTYYDNDGCHYGFYGRLGYVTKDGKKVEGILINLFGHGW